MFIDYLCSHCCELMDIESNQMAVNDVGRKKCADCGWTGERRMHVRSEEDEAGKNWIQNDDRRLL